MTNGSRAAALKGTMFHRTHMGSFRPVGGRMPEAGCWRQDAGGRRLEAGGRRPGAGGQRLEARARGWRPEAGRGGALDGRMDRHMDVIRKQLDAFFLSQRQYWGNFG